jgi:hypothetical protein
MITKKQGAVYTSIATYTAPDVLLQNLLEGNSGLITPFGKKFTSILQLPRPIRVEYSNSKPVTTLSFEIWGTTALWPVIVACSDYIHPHEIPTGEVFYVPDVNGIISIIKSDSKESLSGKVITF